ncbi:R3H-associated N-terminal domain-containing protein [Tricladium varicosporioides]|nr:R3H-associated N-terminal domain-containing protein [Hymenoscyphus varicosporioides]
MAIYSAVPPPEQQAPAPPPTEAPASLTSPSATAVPTTTTSAPAAVDARISLSIPLDHHAAKPVRKEPLRRDSLKRRETLLKGKEGSRRRQRWENDMFLHVPNAQPPLPSDWEVHPTYPVMNVPYYLAPLWDLRNESKSLSRSKSNAKRTKKGETSEKGRVPQELRNKLKKSKGAKTLLQELEEEVRKFVHEYYNHGKKKDESNSRPSSSGSDKTEDDFELVSSEDEEIVFVGRNGSMTDQSRLQRQAERDAVERVLEGEKKVWESRVDEEGGGFARWLVHSLAEYYGLSSRSVTVGARREAWVGVREMKTGKKGADARSSLTTELPRPLYCLV